MISLLNLPFDVTESMVGIVVERKNPAPSVGESLKLYIPKLMTGITQGDPSNHVVKTLSSQIFVNDQECRPTTHTTIKGQNYITAYLENNASWQNVCKSNTVTKTDSTMSVVTESGSTVYLTKTENVYYTSGGEKVECYAPNGKLSKMLFNTTKYISTT